MKSCSLRYVSALFLASFSAWYLSSPFSVVYFSIVISFSLSILIFIFDGLKVKKTGINTILFFCVGFILLQQIFLSKRISDAIVFSLSMLSYPTFCFLSERMSFYKLQKIFMSFLLFSVFIFLIDTFFRYYFPDYGHFSDMNPDVVAREGIGFYVYKTNSIMFLDSNFVALSILPILTSALVVKRNIPFMARKVNVISAVLFLLLLLTLSRAAIISFIFCYFFIYRKNFFLNILFSVLVISLLFFFLKNDGSGESKVYLYDMFFKYLSNENIWDFLVGHGFGSAIEYLGMGAHSSIITLVIETGFIGFILYLLINIFLLYKYKFLSFIILSYQIASFSLSTVAQTMFFISIAITVCLISKYYEVK